ncbi:hypothetical protein [Vagococcus humatus]|uniref:WxL domain-containing protein n=1 Tax=Vagococcus humatus TaxID=1889241 RepID=A0A429Z825_9ENTE|nr:hypothetical protein [Vagococcus humatus]RST89832.1 hypothetical protein C7P63_01770 [Vagococcus humatus]
MKKIKLMSTLLVGATLLAAASPAFAADLKVLEEKKGTTTVEITDYTINPDTDLPSDPGAYTLDQVPNIDFGQHTLKDIKPNVVIGGTYDKDLGVTDTRPTQDSITKALAQIDKVEAEGKVEQTEIDKARTKWMNAVPAGAWKITASATELDGIGSSLTIDKDGTAVEVLKTPGVIVTEASTIPVGTKTYTLGEPKLTIANNNLQVKKYNGTITYTAQNAE